MLLFGEYVRYVDRRQVVIPIRWRYHFKYGLKLAHGWRREAIKVHVHTTSPDEISNYARSKGTVKDVIVEDMDKQVREQMEREGGIVRNERDE